MALHLDGWYTSLVPWRLVGTEYHILIMQQILCLCYKERKKHLAGIMIVEILFQRTVPEGVTESRRTKQARLEQAFPCDSLEKLRLCEGAEGTSGFSVIKL